jgi:branched-chain amino acid transport system ATP-binding protein
MRLCGVLSSRLGAQSKFLFLAITVPNWRSVEMALLEARSVSVAFGGVQALSGVSFDVVEKEIFSIIGPNGAGKTTLLNCISGAYTPIGSISMHGVEMVGMKPHKRPGLGVARTFQNIALFASESVIDNVLVGSDHRLRSGLLRTCLYWTRLGCVAEELAARKEAGNAIHALGLKDFADAPVADLPYGMQKRVELARALVSKPTLLLLDEPTAGMTAGEKHEFAKQIRLLNTEHGVTVIMIEHDMGVVLDISDRIMVLDFGKKIAEGKSTDVMGDPRVREAYLGEEV